MADEKKDTPKSRLWVGLLGALLFADWAILAIWYHVLPARSSSGEVSPTEGHVAGGIFIAVALFCLGIAWGGYRDLKPRP